MLLWDIRWKAFESKVGELDAQRLLLLGVTSIDQVIAFQGNDFMMQLPCSIRVEVERTLANAHSGLGNNCDLIEEQCQGELSPGVYDLVMAIVTLSRSLDAGIDSKQVLETLSYCYQSILDQEIISKLAHSLTESELNELEQVNLNCLKCIESQIETLVEFGGPVSP